MRTTFINTLTDLAEQDERIFLLTPDMGFSVLETFQEKFPERFINVGIAESNAVGIAAGLALSGKLVYVYSIIPFVTMRPFEQVRVDAAYMNTNVRIVGVGAGLSYGPAGGTHHAMEDIALMRSLPNMSVVSPCDPYETEQAVKLSTEHQGPMYIRLARNGEPLISSSNAPLGFGALNTLKDNDNDTLILFTGNSSDVALELVERLEQKGVDADLVSVPFIKPLAKNELLELMSSRTAVFTVEEHVENGGLGSAVSEVIAESGQGKIFKRFSLGDEYSHYVGNQQFIREKMGFTGDMISKEILELLND